MHQMTVPSERSSPPPFRFLTRLQVQVVASVSLKLFYPYAGINSLSFPFHLARTKTPKCDGIPETPNPSSTLPLTSFFGSEVYQDLFIRKGLTPIVPYIDGRPLVVLGKDYPSYGGQGDPAFFFPSARKESAQLANHSDSQNSLFLTFPSSCPFPASAFFFFFFLRSPHSGLRPISSLSIFQRRQTKLHKSSFQQLGMDKAIT